MKLGIDIDGVIADITDPIFERWGYPLNPRVYSLYEAYPNIERESIDRLMNDSSFYEEMLPVSAARWALNVLHQDWEIYYVTARPLSTKRTTHMWLYKYDFPNYNNLHFAHSPVATPYRELSKAQLLLGHGCNYLIDDNPNTAVEFAELGGYALLFCQSLWPYANFMLTPNGEYQRVFTVDNWHEVICQLDTLRGD